MTSLRLAMKRLASRPVLTVLLFVGLAMSVALPTSIPMYTDSALARILADQDFTTSDSRPPFSYVYWYNDPSTNAASFDVVAAAAAYMDETGFPALGLPTTYTSRMLETRKFRMLDTEFSGRVFQRGAASLVWYPEVEELATLVTGRWPSASRYTIEGAIEVTISDAFAQASGLGVGDRLTFEEMDTAAGPIPDFDVAVVGVFEPSAPTDPRWTLINPSQLGHRLYVPRDVLSEILVPQDPTVVKTAAWFAMVDTSLLGVDMIDDLLHRNVVVAANLQTFLPKARVQTDPTAGLLQFKERANTLQRRLNAYSIPTLGLVLVFVMLVVSLTTDERRGEMAVLRSRGATRLQLIGQVAIEAALVSLTGVAAGLLLGRTVADGIGRTRTFLDLGGEPLAHLAPNSRTWSTAAMVAIIACIFQVMPAIGASNQTVVSHDEAATRATRKPWWQRSSLDLVVIAISSTTAYQMLRSSLEIGGNALEDPSTILLPTTLALAVGLVILRILPWVLEGASRILALTPSIVGLTATRRTARTPGTNHVPLLLLVITVGLAVFTASLARTLDLQLFDETYHRIGADWSVIEPHSHTQLVISGPGGDIQLPRVLQTRATFEALPGISQATRVLPMAANMTDPTQKRIQFFGIEPDNFADIAFYRADYSADLSFPASIKRLASDPTAVLVHPDLGPEVGDVIELAFFIKSSYVRYKAVVVGYVTHFPTWYPESQDLLVVGNIDYLFQHTGDPASYQVWMSADREVPDATDGSLEAGFPLLFQFSPISEIADEMAIPERQGVFGVLTFGFLGSILVSMLGFFFATLFRVKRSTVELGILQALGLPPRRVAGMVVIELGLLIGTGIGAGLLTGLTLSDKLLERLVADSGLTATPSLLPEIDHSAIFTITGLLLALFVLSSAALVLVLRRTRVFEALKLGETP